MDILFRKTFKKFRNTYSGPFVICAILFVAGCVLGTFVSCFLDDGDPLFETLSDLSYISVENGMQMTFWEVLIHYNKYCAAAFVFGFSCLGVITIPALSAFRGFSLTFSVSALIRTTGSEGIFFTLILFGAELILSLPCLFIVSVNSFSASRALAGIAFKKSFSEKILTGKFFRTVFLALFIQFTVSVLAYYFIPWLINISLS